MTNTYENLCESAHISPISYPLELQQFNNLANLSEKTASERLTAALQVFFNFMLEETALNSESNLDLKNKDKLLLDYFIGQIDLKIHAELDKILHDPEFQKLEASWTSLKYLIDQTDFKANTKIEILDCDKELLRSDFTESQDITHSGLYNHIYTQEYDTPGGEPIGAVISDYEFNSSFEDINLLENIAKISAVTHSPFIGNVNPQFFYKNSFEEVLQIKDLNSYMERAEYIRWSAFRQSEEARYIGLVLPKFLLRLPYDHEDTQDIIPRKYLWGNSSFAFATTLTRSFKNHGWTVNIRGPEGGGKIEHLIFQPYEISAGRNFKIPLEIIISESRELELAQLGFIPLSYYKNSDYACFFSANSVQKPVLYDTQEANANSRINSRLPYIFLSSRLGHYLKVLQRENIGSAKSREELEDELNRWLNTLITHMNNPGPELMATHPLRDGKVEVVPLLDNPGYYRVNLFVTPHFQVEGVDVKLSLVAQLPNHNQTGE